jgi:hypothetical protein
MRVTLGLSSQLVTLVALMSSLLARDGFTTVSAHNLRARMGTHSSAHHNSIG